MCHPSALNLFSLQNKIRQSISKRNIFRDSLLGYFLHPWILQHPCYSFITSTLTLLATHALTRCKTILTYNYNKAVRKPVASRHPLRCSVRKSLERHVEGKERHSRVLRRFEIAANLIHVVTSQQRVSRYSSRVYLFPRCRSRRRKCAASVAPASQRECFCFFC